METDKPRKLMISIAPVTFLWILGFILLAIGLYYIRDVILVILTAVVIASFVDGPTRWFVAHRIPRVLAVVIVYIVMGGIFAGILSTMVPVLLEELGSLTTLFPRNPSFAFFEQFQNGGAREAFLSFSGVSDPVEFFSRVQVAISGISNDLFQGASILVGGLFNLVLIIVLSFFLSVEEKGVEKFLRLVFPHRKEEYIVDLWNRSQRKIELWFRGQLLAALFVGIFTYIGLVILKIPYALVLGLLSMLFELVPFGAFLAVFPAGIIAYLAGGLPLLLAVFILYFLIQQIEGNLIYPLLMKKVVGIPPLIVILALLIGGTLGGILGIILAMPVAVAIFEYIGDFQEKKAHDIEASLS